MQRAEEMVDRLGEQVGHYVSTVGHSVLRWFARAREEAEDICGGSADDSAAAANHRGPIRKCPAVMPEGIVGPAFQPDGRLESRT